MRAPFLTSLLFLSALLLTGCSTQTVVIGNITSCFVVFGLFYSTVNLKRGG